MKVGDVIYGALILGAVAVISSPSAAAPTPPVLCCALPSNVINYGISMQNTSDGLYLCFQQAALNGSVAVQGMTEVTCVPMRPCR